MNKLPPADKLILVTLVYLGTVIIRYSGNDIDIRYNEELS